MKDINLRNVLVLLGAVLIALLALGFVSTVLNQIIPITIALAVGVVLGRMTVNVNLLSVLRELVRRTPARAAPQADQPKAEAAQEAADEPVRAGVEAIKQRITDVESETGAQQEAEITDFKIRSEEEILADARRLEDEVARRSAAYDPAAALAERRKRLLGDQGDQS